MFLWTFEAFYSSCQPPPCQGPGRLVKFLQVQGTRPTRTSRLLSMKTYVGALARRRETDCPSGLGSEQANTLRTSKKTAKGIKSPLCCPFVFSYLQVYHNSSALERHNNALFVNFRYTLCGVLGSCCYPHIVRCRGGSRAKGECQGLFELHGPQYCSTHFRMWLTLILVVVLLNPFRLCLG